MSQPATADEIHALAVRNIQAVGLKVQPERPAVNVRFQESVDGLAFYEHATDTVVTRTMYVPTAAHDPEFPPFHGMILHEFGHRADGPPGLLAHISGKAMATLFVATIAMLAITIANWAIGAALLLTLLAILAVLAVRNRWRVEYRCDDYAARHGGREVAHAVLTAIDSDHQQALATLPWWKRWIGQAVDLLTHPAPRRRLQRHRAFRGD